MIWIKEIAKNEEGSALATVLVIAVIISLFIGAVLSGIALQSQFIQRDINNSKALYAAEEGIYSFLHSNQGLSSYTSKHQVLLKSGNTATITATFFGGFLSVESKATVSNQQREIRMLVGGESILFEDSAILKSDSISALTVTGNTTVKGNIFTYGKGVRTESFKKVPFRGTLDGEFLRFNKESTFPELHTVNLDIQEEYFKSLFEERNLQKFSSKYTGGSNSSIIQKRDTLFFDGNIEWINNYATELPRNLIIFVDGNFTINGKYKFGAFTKIVVQDTLWVSGAVSGKNMLMYAKKSLQIGGMASVSVQAMSGGTITIRDKAYLQYPSLVYSSKELYKGGAKEVIEIRDQSIVDGTVIYPIQPNSFTEDLFRIKVDTNATVRGSIYNGGQTELLGTVLGTVATNEFYFYESPTDYINWLKDVTIDVTQRPQNYVLPLGFTDSTKYAILDWYDVTN